MTIDRFDYLPRTDRPVIRWPGGARVAFWVVPNVGHYEYLPLPDKVLDFWPRMPHPDVKMYSYFEYGNRVGFWRMMDVLDQHMLRPTVAIGVALLDHFPEMRDAMVKRDWSYMTHGIYPTRTLYSLSVEEERAYYADNRETLLRHTGKELKGMFGPLQSKTDRTPDLMAEAGLIYHTDWFHDDQPFPLKVQSGRMVSVPYTLELNDFPLFRANFEGEDFVQLIKDQFDVLYAEGEANGNVMCISLHPFLIGQPQRIRYLDEALDYVLSHDGVWCTTGEEIAEYYLENYYDETLRHTERHRRRWASGGGEPRPAEASP